LATLDKAFSALLAQAYAALAVFSVEVLAALASLRALEVLFSSASKEATWARASASATINTEPIWKDQAKGNQYRNITGEQWTQGNIPLDSSASFWIFTQSGPRDKNLCIKGCRVKLYKYSKCRNKRSEYKKLCLRCQKKI
jgi:hypothetical protein